MNPTERPGPPPVTLASETVTALLLDKLRARLAQAEDDQQKMDRVYTLREQQLTADVKRLTAELAREKEMASEAMSDASRRLAQLHHIALHVPPILRAYVWHASFQPPELRTAEQVAYLQTATEFVTLLEQFK